MPTNLNINTNYVGDVAGSYIAEMIKEANTISQNLITVLPNLVSSTFVRRIQTTEGFVDYACGWSPSGAITLSERELTPKKIKWDAELCKEDFRNLWTAKEMGFSAHNDSLPTTEQTAILADMGRKVARKIDVDIWEGLGTTGKLNGLIPLLLSDATVIDAPTPVVINKGNVSDELEEFINLIPDAVIKSEGLVMGVSTNIIRALKMLYGQQSRNNGTFLKPNEFEFNSYILTEINGLNANTMVAYDKSQVFFGTGLLSDHNEIRVVDIDDTDLSGQIRMKIVLTGGVQYAYGSEIVLYRGV